MDKKISATNFISVYSYTGSMAFGPNVSKPENENWNSYGDSSVGNSLCKNWSKLLVSIFRVVCKL